MDVKTKALAGLAGLTAASTLTAGVVHPRCLQAVPTNIIDILQNFEGQILTEEKIHLIEKIVEEQNASSVSKPVVESDDKND